MKRTATIIGLVLTAAVSANAQGKAKRPAMRPMLVAQNSSTSVTTPTQTSTTSAAAAAPAPANKVSGLLVVESFANANDLEHQGGRAAWDSVTSVGIGYKITPKIKIEGRYRVQARNRDDTKLDAQQLDYLSKLNSENGSESNYRTIDPTIHLNYSSDVKVAGSNPLVWANRFYVPVQSESLADKRIGILRSQTNMEWDFNPKVSANFLIQGRLYINTADNKNAAVGSDSVLRVIVGPGVTYNFNDKTNAYYSMYTDLRSTGFQRGKFDADAGSVNLLVNEVGFNFTAGPIAINPAYIWFADRKNRADYSDFGTTDRSEYDLILSASF